MRSIVRKLRYSSQTRDNTHPFTDEVDPYKKPAELLQVSPKGLVPALRFDIVREGAKGDEQPRALNESTVILDYLEE